MKAKQPSKAVTVEDSFKSCTSLDAVRHVLQILAPDLLARLREEYEVTISGRDAHERSLPASRACQMLRTYDVRLIQDNGRRPRTLTLKWRHRENGWSRNSASCPMPPAVQVAHDNKPATTPSLSQHQFPQWSVNGCRCTRAQKARKRRQLCKLP